MFSDVCNPFMTEQTTLLFAPTETHQNLATDFSGSSTRSTTLILIFYFHLNSLHLLTIYHIFLYFSLLIKRTKHSQTLK